MGTILMIIILILLVITIYLIYYIYSMRKKLMTISNQLEDIKNGNLDRRLYANQDDIISEIVYKINDIVVSDRNQLIKLKKMDQSYKQLITSLSHDIRTPLASLIGYLSALDIKNVEIEDEHEYIHVATKKAMQLNQYIGTLFEWLKLESGEMIYHIKRENINELTRVVLSDWINKFEKNQIKFSVEISTQPIFIEIDAQFYERILNNLFNNIVNHADANFISIKVEKSQDNVVIYIQDNGIGIKEKDLPHIFDRLYKSDDARNAFSNGLGLAIAKELTLGMNGIIDLKSRENEGTLFILTFQYMD